MDKFIESVEPDKIIRLAAMECGASCLMTALGMLGRNPNHFMLDYWNLTYIAPTLMGNRELGDAPFEWMFGLQLELRNDHLSSIIQVLEEGGWALVLSNPANLEYFPKKFITDELGGDDHYVMLYGYDAARRLFRIVDPIAHFIGEITQEELALGVESTEEMEYYALLPGAKEFVQPTDSELFAYAAGRNYAEAFAENTLVAYESFREDIAQIVNWEAEARDYWIYHNNVTISTIVKLRATIWKAFCDLGALTSEQTEQGQRLVQSIVKQWTTFNFQLTKFKKHADENLVTSLLNQFSAIREVEVSFLAWMNQIANGGELNDDKSIESAAHS